MEGKNQDTEFASKVRRDIFLSIVGVMTAVLIGMLVYMQIIRGSFYGQKSEAQGIKPMVIEPVRGAVYDRNGVLLVGSQPSFNVVVTPREITPDAISRLAEILEVDTIYISERLAPYKGSFEQVKIWRDATTGMIGKIEEWHDRLPGVVTNFESKRLYVNGLRLTHTLGYTKEIAQKQLEKDTTKYYAPGDAIGVTGLEGSYEDSLRGVKGYEFIAVNALGQRVNGINEGHKVLDAKDGYSLSLGIDAKLQEYAEELMSDKRGAVVAIDPQNGDVLAMTSKPDYDLNDFNGRTPAKLYNALLNDPDKPLYNRATLTRYPPGSTFKLVSAAAALQEHVINERSTFTCPGYFTYGDHTFNCDRRIAHGTINVENAIRVSCDVFFYQLILKEGFDIWRKYALMFGFGQRSGIDIGEEGPGLIPSDEYFAKQYHTQNWPKGVLVSLGIGQGDMGVTPLQMACYAGALGTGQLFQPHVVKSIYNSATKQTEYIQPKKKEIPLDSSVWTIIRRSLFDVVNAPGGTAYAVRIPDVAMCGKTGTAQNPQGKDHAWFIAYAPADHPTIAIAVLCENAGWGAEISAPIASKLVEYYLKGRRHDIIAPVTPSDSLHPRQQLHADAIR